MTELVSSHGLDAYRAVLALGDGSLMLQRWFTASDGTLLNRVITHNQTQLSNLSLPSGYSTSVAGAWLALDTLGHMFVHVNYQILVYAVPQSWLMPPYKPPRNGASQDRVGLGMSWMLLLATISLLLTLLR